MLAYPSSKDFKITIRVYGNMGLVYTQTGQLDSAAYYLKLALKIGKETRLESRLMASVYGNLGEVYALQGNYLDAIEEHQKVTEIGTLSHKVQAHLSIGNLFMKLGLVSMARENYQKAVAFAQASGVPKTTVKGYAAMINATKNLEEGRKLIKKGLAICDSFRLKRPKLLFLAAAGTFFLDSMHHQEALPYFQQAFILAKKLEDQAVIHEVTLSLARIKQLQGQYQEAIKLGQIVQAPLEKKSNPVLLSELYDVLTKSLIGLKQANQAVLYLQKREEQEAQIDDKIYIKEAISQYIQRQNEKEQAALKLAKVHAEKLTTTTRAQAQLNYWGLGLLSLFLGTGGVVYYSSYKQKKASAEQLTQINELLEREKEKLLASNKKLQRFSEVVSHDILSNLDLILSTGNVLVGSKPNAKNLNKYYTLTQNTSHQLKDYCLGLLADARSAPKEDSATEEWADPMPILHRVLARFGPELRAAGMEVDLQELSPAPLSAVLMEQVFQNLVSNTLRHGTTAQQARLVIREDKDRQGQVRWIIEDNGPGIASERRETLFDSRQKRPGPGQHIGLSLLRAALREQGADIRVETAVEGGARWIVAMP